MLAGHAECCSTQLLLWQQEDLVVQALLAGGRDLKNWCFSFPSNKNLEMELLGHLVDVLYCFEESLYCFPQWLYQVTLPPTVPAGSFSPHPRPHLLFIIFSQSHSGRCEVVSWFCIAFPWWLLMLSKFSYVYWPSLYLWRNVSSLLELFLLHPINFGNLCFVSRYFWIFCLIVSLIHGLCSSMLFNLYMFVFFLVFLL